ncbi:hypothetical protein ACF0H5_008635 [Mactra antiquata]
MSGDYIHKSDATPMADFLHIASSIDSRLPLDRREIKLLRDFVLKFNPMLVVDISEFLGYLGFLETLKCGF